MIRRTIPWPSTSCTVGGEVTVVVVILEETEVDIAEVDDAEAVKVISVDSRIG